MAGFLSGLANELGNQIDERRAIAAYEPLVNAVYGGQPQQQSGGFLTNLFGGGQQATPAVPAAPAQAGAQASGAPAPNGSGLPAAPQMAGMGLGAQSPQLDRGAILGLLRSPQTREQGVALLMNGGRLPQVKSTLPNDLQEYQYAVGQGYKGGFLDYQKELKAAGASRTNVSTTVNPAAAENAFQKTTGEQQAKELGDIIAAGDQSQRTIADVQALRDIGARIGTGKAAEVKGLLGPYARALGIDVSNLGDIEAYNAISARQAQNFRQPGTGATSDFDAGQFLKQAMTVGKTPEGNKLIGDTLQGVAEYDRARGAIARKVRNGDMTRAQGESAMQALPDPLSSWRKATAGMQEEIAPMGSVPTISTPAEAANLPSGTRFKTPDGTIRVKP